MACACSMASLHLKIDRGVPVGRGDTGVAKPLADCVLGSTLQSLGARSELWASDSSARGLTPIPKDLTAGLEIWEPLGITVLRLEYRAKKADWGQPGFSRMLRRKSST